MQLQASGKRVSYEIRGEGKPLLLVHGWGGTKASMKPLAILLSQKYTCITLDLPGFGESENPDASWGIEEYAKLVAEFCKKLHLHNIIYFGHSFGGSLGIYLAVKYPSLMEKLILCNSSYKREVKVSKISLFLKNLAKYVPFLLRQEAQLKQIYYRLFFRRSDLYRFPLLEPNLRKIVLQDLTKYLPLIKKPTLILWGEKDDITPLPLAYELHQKISGSQLFVFLEKTHGLPLKNPEIVFSKMLPFI